MAKESIISRAKKAWNVFFNNRDPTYGTERGLTYSYRPDRPRIRPRVEKSLVISVYNKIAMDVAAISIQHVITDKNGRYSETVDDSLNRCFNLEANVDQTGRSFIHDAVLSMFDEGVVALIPIDVDEEVGEDGLISSRNILSMRTGKIVQWSPDSVKVRAYDERDGQHKEIWVNKKHVAIIENPLYAVVNEPNSTMQRLIRKLAILDAVDEQSGSGKLDLIIQLPYVIKTESRRQQAEERRRQIEEQLAGSKYGIAYTDGTEHITQLNRAVENNLMAQVQYLTDLLYGQLGITPEIMNGTADEKIMLNYMNRTIEPILSAIVGESKRKFLSETARSRGHSIMYFSDPFKLVPAAQLAELSDKLTRNEILTSNEVRQIIGFKPSSDPNADQLRNKNLNQSSEEINNEKSIEQKPNEFNKEEKNQNGNQTE